ncbi:MAG TPA: SprT family zinc-dependent metalloprotease [Novosphingobium sp.]|nr:SprT family zinc-dependent metalloprotease [Novosphingobium sp.]
MLDWLRRRAPAIPEIEVAGRRVPVAIRRLANARRMTLRVAADGSEIRISIPRWGRDADALDFARLRLDWIEMQLARNAPPSPPGPGTALPYRGALLTIRHDPAGRRTPRVLENALVLGGPPDAIEQRLVRWLKAEARAHFARDLADYSPRAGVPLPPLALTNARARWGSCSSQGTVRLNWRLVMAPDAVRRSVVAHEVAHLVHFDHSPRFHALLGDLFEGDLDAANRWLKRHGRSLYTHFG